MASEENVEPNAFARAHMHKYIYAHARTRTHTHTALWPGGNPQSTLTDYINSVPFFCNYTHANMHTYALAHTGKHTKGSVFSCTITSDVRWKTSKNYTDGPRINPPIATLRWRMAVGVIKSIISLFGRASDKFINNWDFIRS